MAALNELIQKIENPELRAKIQEAANKLTKQKKFGLVFEEHLPECTPLYDIPVRKGAKVSVRNEKANEIYTVLKIENDKALCLSKSGDETKEFDINELVTTAELGDPIYPCLQPLGEVCNAPDSELWHTLIEADNYHALQLLEYLYAGKVDCIYIDPPYNTGATDWKYNNKYVDENDEYRHSKWLSFIQKRLVIAKKLLNPNNSVLIVTIDEKEYLHLGCLLEEMFPSATIQMITTVISGKGVSMEGLFSRVEEYIFIVTLGEMKLVQQHCNMLNAESSDEDETETESIEFIGLRRRNTSNYRESRPNQFYPFFVDEIDGHIIEIGDVVPHGVDRNTIPVPNGCVAIWPLDPKGEERIWGLIPESARNIFAEGCLKVTNWNQEKKTGTVKYLASGTIDKIRSGAIMVAKRDQHGAIEEAYYIDANDKTVRPRRVWNMKTHNASTYGTLLLKKFLVEKRFSYPKSLYAVADTLRFYLSDKPNALVVDFFAGSGTTLHALNLLNAEDGGTRRCIMVTNNEISEEERADFESKGIKQGDAEWEARGIANYVTWPRTVCSIKGVNVNGQPIKDEYITASTITKDVKRQVQQIPFVDNYVALSLADKKKLITLITNKVLPGKIVEEDADFIISESSDHTASVLVNDSKWEEWIDELTELEHISEYYVITQNKKLFNKIKKEISERLPLIQETIPLKIPMSNGFKTNAIFFKLGFLDKTKVSLGMQFKELLSTLWMKAGAIGKCPIIDDHIPDMMILPENKMAILNNENRFGEFADQLAQYPEIEVVYLVTDYESSFVAMTQNLEGKLTYQLYRDYLDNFRINAGRNSR